MIVFKDFFHSKSDDVRANSKTLSTSFFVISSVQNGPLASNLSLDQNNFKLSVLVILSLILKITVLFPLAIDSSPSAEYMLTTNLELSIIY